MKVNHISLESTSRRLRRSTRAKQETVRNRCPSPTLVDPIRVGSEGWGSAPHIRELVTDEDDLGWCGGIRSGRAGEVGSRLCFGGDGHQGREKQSKRG